MIDSVKNLRRKNYNPCGTLTGIENEMCDKASKNFFDLPFVSVMRDIVVEEVSNIAGEEKFSNPGALKDWANFNFGDVENKIMCEFDSEIFSGFSTLQKGTFKYFIHLLFENRYNIFYNRLVDYCGELDEKIFAAVEKSGLTFDELERKINSLAQSGDYFSPLENATDELLNFVMTFIKAGGEEI